MLGCTEQKRGVHCGKVGCGAPRAQPGQAEGWPCALNTGRVTTRVACLSSACGQMLAKIILMKVKGRGRRHWGQGEGVPLATGGLDVQGDRNMKFSVLPSSFPTHSTHRMDREVRKSIFHSLSSCYAPSVQVPITPMDTRSAICHLQAEYAQTR